MFCRHGVVILCSILALAALGSGCASESKYSTNDTSEIRSLLLKPSAPGEQEKLLQPRRLTSIGQMASVAGLDPLPCIGFGLVTGLGGNGASDKESVPEEVRGEVIKSLVRSEGKSVMESSALLRSTDASVVAISGEVPAGAGPGTLFNVTVSSMDASLSLEGGFLRGTYLQKFVTRKGETIRGDIVAEASGPVVAGAAPDTVIASTGNARQGTVFDGAKSVGERALIVILKKEHASGKRAILIEYLLNRRLYGVGAPPGASGAEYAHAMDNRIIVLRVPPVYRRYAERFADVVKAVKGSDYYGAPSKSDLEDLSKRMRSGAAKEKYLASVALECIGTPAIPYLKSAVEGGDDWTLLYGATALAYLNDAEAGDLVIRAAGSAEESVRFEAVRLMGQMEGRRVIQTLRERLFDSSAKVASEAVKSLVGLGSDAAQVAHFAGFDLVAVPGAAPGILVGSKGRPTIVMTSVGTPLKGRVQVTFDDLGLGSVDENQVGIIEGAGADSKMLVVDATVDSVITALARSNPPFEAVNKILSSLEDNGNLPFRIVWLN